MNLFERTFTALQAGYRHFTTPSVQTDQALDLSSHDSPYYAKSQLKPYNPDSLVKKKGLVVFEQMVEDDQVKACMNFKVNSILAPGWRIEPATDPDGNEAKNAEYVEHAKFIEYCFREGFNTFTPTKQINNFKKSLKRIMSALAFGFSVTEKCYTVFKFGKYAGKIGLNALKTRAPHSFEFHTDDFNNLQELWQYQPKGIRKFLQEDLRYFIIYVYDADGLGFDNWYGKSDLKAAYRHYWSKDVIIRFRNIYLERFGMGIIVGKYPKGMQKAEQDDLLAMIKNVQAKTAFKIPKEVELEILESAKSNGQASFNETIDKCNIYIARSLLIPDKIGLSDNSTGALAQSETHFDLFLMALQDTQTDAEELVNEQVIVDLIDLNFVNVDRYPQFKFNPMRQDDKIKLCDAFTKAVQTGTVLPTEEDEEHIREQLDFPKRTEESKLLPNKPQAVNPFNPQGQGDPNQVEDPNNPGFDMQGNPMKAKQMEKQFQLTLARKPYIFEEGIDFQKEGADIDDLDVKIALKVSGIITDMKNALYENITRDKLVENKDTGAVNKLGLDFLKQLRLEWQNALQQGFQLGSRHALAEVKAKSEKKFGLSESVGNLPPEKAMQFFLDKAFWITGAMKDDILKNAKNLIFDGIKSGLSNAQVIRNLESYFSKYTVEQMIGDGSLRAIQNIPGRIETIVRTNLNDAYNQGRLALYQEEGVKDMVVAYMYSAIMDDRTSDICAYLDGRIYRADSPIWAKIIPPNHFGCRSTLIPIMAGESFIESDPPSMWPDKGFGG